ncbi:right-handed parallel beta-helix repeat-containing protein [Methylocystis heyeri]|uniref:Right handed beta helix domain-containing protein n=1 Tax=Methylocystis heyeri TaxID=391905 RepID=A0A6B8KI95_9HYPH|nr:right-handed parallel beta-helix repeat-containing protein [Methylocystis heyeri]QGM46238.1 hypothetical protein H2LOC_011325 [Methylocystis heyeri]
MKRSIVGFIFVCVALLLGAAPAAAQATRTWVSGVGDDANPCSRTAPCKTFAGAISKTAVAGEINVLDPGGFGAVTITKSITIRSDHTEAGVLVSGTNGVVVSAGAGDTVILEGLDFDGANGTGLDGVHIIGGGATYVINCTIRHFSQNGVSIATNTAGSRVFIQDSKIIANAGGLNVQGAGGVANVGIVSHSIIDHNSSFAVQANGAGNLISVGNSVLSGSPIAINLLNGASAVSFGPSNSVSGSGAFTSTAPFK